MGLILSSHDRETLALIVARRRLFRSRWSLACLAAALWACAPLGMTLPTDELNPPQPEGGRIKPDLGWLTSKRAEAAAGAPTGQLAISVVRTSGRSQLQQVRHYMIGEATYGDSILLDRTTLKPVITYRWTPAGTYIAKYNHRVIDRTFVPVHGSPSTSSETLDVEPFSWLGMELLVASLPLSSGYFGVIPVAVDTASRGWGYMKFTVQSEQQLQERRDQKGFDVWIVDCENGPGATGLERMRLWIRIDGRSVRRIEHIDADNVVLGTLRRTLLPLPVARSGE